MKIRLKFIAAAIAGIMLCGAVNAAADENKTYSRLYNFTSENINGAVNVKPILGKAPSYTYEKGYGFVDESSNMPKRTTDTNKIIVSKNGYSYTQDNIQRYNITDKKGNLLSYNKATDYNYGGLIFRVKEPAGGYNIKVEVENSDTALISVSGMQTYRLENSPYWDSAKQIANQHQAKWQDNIWEFDYANGKDYIDIEIEPAQANKAVVLKSIEITPIENKAENDKATVYLLGDSTLKSYQFAEAPMCGWAQVFDRLYDTSKINIVNYSMGGRSVKQMYQEGRLNDILMTASEGDILLIQSGHNDEKNGTDKGTVSDPTARFGTGSTEEMYKNYLEQYYIPAATARGVIPILVTPITRVKVGMDNDYVYKDSFTTKDKQFTKAMREAANETNCSIIDLNKMSVDYLNTLGVKGAEAVVMSLEAGETPGKTNNGSYANGHPQNKIDGTHMKEALAKQYAYLVSKDIYENSANNSAYAIISAALKPDAKKAMDDNNSAEFYTEMAKDCITGDNARYRNQIEKMLELDIMQKDENGNFNPNSSISVNEYITAISKLYGLNKNIFSYSDGSLTREVMAAINLDAYNAKFTEKPKYMTDYNGTTVTPDSPDYDPNLISDEAQYYPLRGFNKVSDIKEISPELKDKIKQAYSLGLIRCDIGVETGKMENGSILAPKQSVTRAKAAKSLYFMYVLSSDANELNDIQE